MEETPSTDDSNSNSEELSSRGGRPKQKIRIKNRQRVKIKRRPRGYKFKKYWKKNSRNFFAFLILAVLLSGTVYLVLQVIKQRIEMNQHQQRNRL